MISELCSYSSSFLISLIFLTQRKKIKISLPLHMLVVLKYWCVSERQELRCVLIGSDDFLFFLDILVDTTQRMCGLGA
jgi:hypothetical protein